MRAGACAGMGGTGNPATIRHWLCAHVSAIREMRSPAFTLHRPLPPPFCGCSEAGDWQAAFDERAGFLEFDAGYYRPEAERMVCADTCAQRGASPAEWAASASGTLLHQAINGSEANDS